MRLGSHGGSQTILTLASRTPDTPTTAFLTSPGSSAADGQFGVVSHVDRDHAVVVDVDLVNQTKLVEISRYFWVVDGLERGDDFIAQARQLAGWNGRWPFRRIGRGRGAANAGSSRGSAFRPSCFRFVRAHPTEPSNETEISFCASTANSIGNCCSTSLTKPLTTRAVASSADSPRWRQ